VTFTFNSYEDNNLLIMTQETTSVPSPSLYITSSSEHIICLYENYSFAVVLSQTKRHVIIHIKHLK
jgi:hypothetical protein